MTILLFLVINSPFVLAAPITTTSSVYSPCACLAILLAFLSVMTALVSIKHLYMKRRRRVTRCLNDTSISSYIASSRKSSTESGLPIFRSIPSKDSTFAAFLVGFLGSPTWETKFNLWNKDAPSVPSLGDSTRSTSTWRTRSTKGVRSMRASVSDPEKVAADEFGSKLSHWVTSSLSSKSKSSKSTYPSSSISHKHSITLPLPSKHTETASKPRSIHRQSRRSSLPAAPLSRKVEYDRTSLQKRHSSLRSNKCRRHSTSPLPYPPSLRIIDTTLSRDGPLPLLATGQSSTNHAYLERGQVPFLPVMHLSSVLSDTTDRHPSINYNISRPYPLTPTKRIKAIEGLPVESPDNTSTVMGLASPSTAALFPHPQDPIPHLPNAMKPRKSSLKARRSPPLGPSPLRIMTLPEGSLNDITSLDFSSSAPQTYNDHPSQRLSYSHIGLGFPPTESRRSSLAAKPDDDKRSSTSSRCLTRVKENESNVLLGIIRELVEETSQWDASLYMDNGFRGMLENISSSSTSLAGSTHTAASSISIDEEVEVVRDHLIDSHVPTTTHFGVAW